MFEEKFDREKKVRAVGQDPIIPKDQSMMMEDHGAGQLEAIRSYVGHDPTESHFT